MGKTVLAKSLARRSTCTFGRLQFTPDLLPSDVIGVSVCNRDPREFDFRPGPIFANVVLGDEINRASPKTQSALLEAMQERQVTVDGDDLRARAAVHRHRHAEPARVRGHLSAARGAARPLPARVAIGYPPRGEEARCSTIRRPRRARPSSEAGRRPEYDLLGAIAAARPRLRRRRASASTSSTVVRHTRDSSLTWRSARSPRAGIALLRIGQGARRRAGTRLRDPRGCPVGRGPRAFAPGHRRAGVTRRRDRGASAMRSAPIAETRPPA